MLTEKAIFLTPTRMRTAFHRTAVDNSLIDDIVFLSFRLASLWNLNANMTPNFQVSTMSRCQRALTFDVSLYQVRQHRPLIAYACNSFLVIDHFIRSCSHRRAYHEAVSEHGKVRERLVGPISGAEIDMLRTQICSCQIG